MMESQLFSLYTTWFPSRLHRLYSIWIFRYVWAALHPAEEESNCFALHVRFGVSFFSERVDRAQAQSLWLYTFFLCDVDFVSFPCDSRPQNFFSVWYSFFVSSAIFNIHHLIHKTSFNFTTLQRLPIRCVLCQFSPSLFTRQSVLVASFQYLVGVFKFRRLISSFFFQAELSRTINMRALLLSSLALYWLTLSTLWESATWFVFVCVLPLLAIGIISNHIATLLTLS